MPCKITINTVAPPESKDKWMHLTPDGYNTHYRLLVWAALRPGYISQTGQWITPDIEHERTFIFDTRENAEAFMRDRQLQPEWKEIMAYQTATNVTATFELTDI
jgi:hypothetical protein